MCVLKSLWVAGTTICSDFSWMSRTRLSFNSNVCHSTDAEGTYSTVPEHLLCSKRCNDLVYRGRGPLKHWVTNLGNIKLSIQISNCHLFQVWLSPHPSPVNILWKGEQNIRPDKKLNATHTHTKEFNKTTKFLFISICCIVFETKSATKVLVL